MMPSVMDDSRDPVPTTSGFEITRRGGSGDVAATGAGGEERYKGRAFGSQVRLRVRPLAPGSCPAILRLRPRRYLPTATALAQALLLVRNGRPTARPKGGRNGRFSRSTLPNNIGVGRGRCGLILPMIDDDPDAMGRTRSRTRVPKGSASAALLLVCSGRCYIPGGVPGG